MTVCLAVVVGGRSNVVSQQLVDAVVPVLPLLLTGGCGTAVIAPAAAALRGLLAAATTRVVLVGTLNFDGVAATRPAVVVVVALLGRWRHAERTTSDAAAATTSRHVEQHVRLL